MSAWLLSTNHINALVEGAIRLGVIGREDATKTGRMLVRANIKSLNARYGDTRKSLGVGTYWYSAGRAEPLSDVSLLKQVYCYNYQTCEYDGFYHSPAYRLMRRIEAALPGVNRDSPGYDEAPWGI
jgi:hypothetical protein